MKGTLTAVRERVRALPDEDKLALVDDILVQLDRPDPELDAVWSAEVRERRQAYRTGRMESRSHAEVMKRYRKA
jgi:hypothetical protein